jgi:hypothetical protein
MGIKGIRVLEIVLHIDIGEASPRNTKSTNHFKELHIEINNMKKSQSELDVLLT